MKVSVIVATYGDDRWEELGGSVPLDSAALQSPHEAFAHHLPDGTLAQTRNEAAAGATGDWLCFLDADDELAPGYLRAHYREYTARLGDRPPITMTAHLFVPAVSYQEPGVPRTVPAIPAWGQQDPRAPLETINSAVIGTLIHRDVFRALGGFREWPMYEDWDLWLRAIRYGCSLVPVPDAVYIASGLPGRNDGPGQRETYDAIRKDLGIGGAPPRGQAVLPRRGAGSGCQGCGGST